MKKWKWGLLAFLTGEFLALWHSDETFRKKVGDEGHIGKKLQIIASRLLGFNKQLIKEAKEIDYRKHGRKAKAYLQKEIKKFKAKAQKLEDERKDLSNKKIKPMLAELDEEFSAFKKEAKELLKELDEAQDLDEKIKTIKKQITKLKKRKLS